MSTQPVITGRTTLIAHLGYPTESFKAPMIYNPWFAARGIDAVVVPMGVKADDYPGLIASLRHLTNLRGALVTMPHKVTTLGLMDEVTPTAQIAGACNAILLRADGSLLGDQFDGAGFVRGVQRKGRAIAGARALVVGSGGVGSAIAASLAADGLAAIGLFDANPAAAEALGQRLRTHYPALEITLGSNDPAGWDIVVNATPLGMRPDDPMPFDPTRLAPASFVGEVVMRQEFTPLLRAASARGCQVQVGTDMLFEMIPAYLEFFGFGTATAEELRAVATLEP
jgi:shikimate dehydrogenase